MKRLSILLSLIIFIFSCGPNTQEKAAQQKAHDDSVSATVAAQTQARIEQKNSLQVFLQKANDDKAKLEQSLIETKAQLDAENTRMNSINQFHFLRNASEHAEQVRQQSLVIQNIEVRIKNIQSSLEELENKVNRATGELNALK